MKTGQSKFITTLFSLAFGFSNATFADDGAAQTSAKALSTQVHIEEFGKLNPEKFVGKIAYFYYGDNGGLGIHASKSLEALLKQKGIEHGTFMPRNNVKVFASARIFASDSNAFDTKNVIINDIRIDKLVMSKSIRSDTQTASSGRDPFKVDAAVMHHGAQIANTGSLGGYGIGVLANVAVNLATRLFSEKSPETEIMNDDNMEKAVANCGEPCSLTHHQVIYRVNFGNSPEDNYTLLLDKVDNKVDSSSLLPLAKLGLELITVKFQQVISGEQANPPNSAPENTGAMQSAPDEKTVQ